MSSVKVEVVAHRSCSSTGEGPHWEESSQTLLYVDIQKGDVHRYNSQTGQDETYHVGGGTVSLVVPRESGGYIVGFNKTLMHYDPESGRTNPLLEVEHKKENRFNDGKCDRAGRLYAGTMTRNKAQNPEDFKRQDASLYSLEKNGSLQKRIGVVDLSNGLAWTSDDKTMYYIDSIPRCIYGFDYDADTGELSNKRVVKDYGEGSKDELGFPDGMCIDTDDKIWVACFGVGKVIRWDPTTGEQLQVIDIPGAKKTTSVCFGGKNYDELYVTSCGGFMTEEDFVEQPNAGSLFKVTGLGVKGTPSNAYRG